MKQPLQVLAGLFLLAVLLRFPSFFPSVINHDESTYLVIADMLTRGYTYFIDYVDTKPAGIFTLLAGFQMLFGKSIFLFRVFAALCLALTAFLLYLVQRQWGQPERVGVATGVIYLILNSLFTYYGISPNTETFFNLFTLTGLYLILRRRGGWEYLLAGLALGYGFLIKYMVAFDALAFGILLLLEAWNRRQPAGQFLGRTILLIVGFLAPISIFFAYYWQMGELQTAWFHSFVVAGRYPDAPGFLHFLKHPGDFFLRFLPVTLLFGYGLFARRIDREVQRFGIIWAICSMAAVLAPGIPFGHYFIQFMLPFSLVAGWIFGQPRESLPRFYRAMLQPRVGGVILAVILTANLAFQVKDYILRPDYPRQVARYLAERLEPGDRIYTGNFSQIIYLLLDQTPPTKYLHPSLFWEEKHIRALEIDLPEENRKVRAGDPRFILVKDELPDDRFDDWITSGYVQVATFNGNRFKVFERK